MSNPNITAQDLVRREVYYCVSQLVSELTSRADSFDPEDAEALYDLQVARRDYDEPCQEQGWVELEDPTWIVFTDGNTCVVIRDGDEDEAWDALSHEIDYDPQDHDADATPQEICEAEGWELADSPTFYNPETGETSEADDWVDLAGEFDIDPYEAEAYEHWLVSDWLANKLTERGYTVREVFGLTIWARGTTGQAIYIDGVIEDIVAELNSRD